MKKSNELYVERLPQESIRAYFKRFESKTGSAPSKQAFLRGYKPLYARYEGRSWNEHHRILMEQVGADNYIWYGYDFFFANEEDVFLFKLCCRD